MKTTAWHIPFYTRQCRAAAFTENETGLDSVRDRLYYIRSIEHLRPARKYSCILGLLSHWSLSTVFAKAAVNVIDGTLISSNLGFSLLNWSGFEINIASGKTENDNLKCF